MGIELEKIVSHESVVMPASGLCHPERSEGSPLHSEKGGSFVPLRMTNRLASLLPAGAVGVKQAKPTDPTLARFAEFGKNFIATLDRPVIKVEPTKTMSFTFDKSIVFQWPYRYNSKQPWELMDFIMLGGTKVTFEISYKQEGDVIVRRTDITFTGDKDKQHGFWGPVDRSKKDFADEKFPGSRTDRKALNEAFDPSTGKPIDHYKSRDGVVSPIRPDYWMSCHNEKTGDICSCDDLKFPIKILGIPINIAWSTVFEWVGGKFTKYDGHDAYTFDFADQVHSTFADPHMQITSQNAKERYKMRAQRDLATEGRTIDLAVLLYYLWWLGLEVPATDLAPKVKYMEK